MLNLELVLNAIANGKSVYVSEEISYWNNDGTLEVGGYTPATMLHNQCVISIEPIEFEMREVEPEEVQAKLNTSPHVTWGHLKHHLPDDAIVKGTVHNEGQVIRMPVEGILTFA